MNIVEKIEIKPLGYTNFVLVPFKKGITSFEQKDKMTESGKLNTASFIFYATGDVGICRLPAVWRIYFSDGRIITIGTEDIPAISELAVSFSNKIMIEYDSPVL